MKNQNSKFYATDEFDKLNEKWKQKLEKSGFDDIESSEFYLKKWESTKFLSKSSRERYMIAAEFDAEYYRLAGHFLNDYPFKNRRDEIVWEYHSEGLTVREIAVELKSKNFKYHSYSVVQTDVKRLSNEMFKFYKSSDENE